MTETDLNSSASILEDMAPLLVEVELTERCNLSCCFCYHPEEARHSMLAKEILERLDQEQVPNVMLTGGEPLLHPEFRELVDFATGRFQCVTIQTNGTYLTDEMVSFLEEKEVFGINISLHGPESVHDSLVGVPGSYKKALAAATRIAAAKRMSLWVNTVILNENLASVGEHLENLFAAGVTKYTFTRFTAVGAGKGISGQQVIGRDVIRVLCVIRAFQEKHPGISAIMANCVPRCALPDDLAYFTSSCSFGLSRFYVDGDGNLLHCGMFRQVYGNILKSSIASIKKTSAAYAKLGAGRSIPASCLACKELDGCRGGCRAAAAASTGDACGLDPLVSIRSKAWR